MSLIKEKNASLFILLNAILWGSSYVWSKMLLGYLPYFSILFVFSLGGLILLTAVFFPSIRSIDRKTVAIGAVISTFSILSNTFCMLSLKYTSSSNAAFIVQMTVIITPLIMSVTEKKIPGIKVILSAVAALAGLMLLTCDFRNFSLNPGDLLALGNAVFFSLYLAALRLYTGKTDPVKFTFMQHITSTVAFLVLAMVFEVRNINLNGLASPLFIALIAISTAISVTTILIQSKAIKYVRPEKATLIYTLEPVTAAILAFLLIGEKLAGIRTLAGCALILLSILISVYKRNAVKRLKVLTKPQANY
jgi:drug/metabolite transporter (DMT)-like permease